MAELKVVANATCTFCGCVCDDMELTVEGHKIAKAKNACVMGLSRTRGKHLNVEAALSLARDLNEFTRFCAKPMRGHGNVTGADNVVSWQTGSPRFNPGELTTADTLARGEADAALSVASDPMGNFSQPAREHLGRIPYTAGTVYRMDDVPIPLRPAFESPYPSDQEVLTRIERRIRELQGIPTEPGRGE